MRDESNGELDVLIGVDGGVKRIEDAVFWRYSIEDSMESILVEGGESREGEEGSVGGDQ